MGTITSKNKNKLKNKDGYKHLNKLAEGHDDIKPKQRVLPPKYNRMA